MCACVCVRVGGWLLVCVCLFVTILVGILFPPFQSLIQPSRGRNQGMATDQAAATTTTVTATTTTTATVTVATTA